jgi:hypothetical protein
MLVPVSDFLFVDCFKPWLFFHLVNNNPSKLKKLETFETALPLNFTSGEGWMLVPVFDFFWFASILSFFSYS